MLESVISLAYLPVNQGGSFGNLMFQMEQAGVFSYVIPFLMIFALVYSILAKTSILGDNRGINAILALAVGFMSLQFGFVSYFFAELFPRMGAMLGLILVGLILLGLFFNFKDKDGEKTTASKVFGGFVIVGILVILYQTFASVSGWSLFGYSWGISYWFRYNFSTILGVVLFLIVVLAIIFGGKKEGEDSILQKLAKTK